MPVLMRTAMTVTEWQLGWCASVQLAGGKDMPVEQLRQLGAFFMSCHPVRPMTLSLEAYQYAWLMHNSGALESKTAD